MIDSTSQSTGLQAPPFGSCFAPDNSGERCHLSDLLRLVGGHFEAQAPGIDAPVTIRRLRSGESLFHEGAPADAFYIVRAGTFKTFRTAEDGYEQVLGFSVRAEILGFDAVCCAQHPTACVALEDSSVFVLLIRELLSPVRCNAALDHVVTLAVSRALRQHNDLAEVMAAVAAEVRLARFVLQLSHRMESCGQSPRRFHLRMSRRDIASHLGVAHETASRSFQALARWQLLAVDNREVEILDMSGLKALARSTRRQGEELGHASGPLHVNAADHRASASLEPLRNETASPIAA